MSRHLAFFVPGIAQPAGSKRIGRHGTRYVVLDDNKKAAGWKERVALAAAEAKEKAGITGLLDGPLSLSVSVYRARPQAHLNAKGEVKANAPEYPATKPDLTKLVRGLEDALLGVVYADDSRIVEQHAEKCWVSEDGGPWPDPGAVIIVSELD